MNCGTPHRSTQALRFRFKIYYTPTSALSGQSGRIVGVPVWHVGKFHAYGLKRWDRNFISGF